MNLGHLHDLGGLAPRSRASTDADGAAASGATAAGVVPFSGVIPSRLIERSPSMTVHPLLQVP